MTSLWRRLRGGRGDGPPPPDDGSPEGPTELAQEQDPEQIGLIMPAVQKVRLPATEEALPAESGLTGGAAADEVPTEQVSLNYEEIKVEQSSSSAAEGHGGQIEVESFSWGETRSLPAGGSDLAAPAPAPPEGGVEYTWKVEEGESAPPQPAGQDLAAAGGDGDAPVEPKATGDIAMKGQKIHENAPPADGTSKTAMVGESPSSGEAANPLRAAVGAAAEDEPTTLSDLGGSVGETAGALGSAADAVEAVPDDADLELDEPEL